MTADPSADRRPQRTPLERPRVCVVGGVCVALADHLGWSVAVVRWIFAGTTLLSGAGLLFYLWLWALTPLRPVTSSEPGEHVIRRVNIPWLLAGAGVVVGVAGVALAAGSAESAAAAAIGAIVLLVAAVAWDQFVDDEGAAPVPLSAEAFRMSAGAFLLGLALVLGLLQAVRPSSVLWLAVVALSVAGVAVLVAPWALRLWRELIVERTARIKEEQRAEMAAHLHDSVLQTLAIIQNRAGASSEVGRIARAQERELRDWLYADLAHAPVSEDGDLATELHDIAAALEVDHAVHFDIVTVGEPVRQAPSEVAAAAREAMLNAARHAGGDVSVYIEAGPRAVDVFIRDRGPGFDADALPEGRLGVRESIIGRMRRAGGHATVTSRSTGTEVHLSIELSGESE